ncbi:tRNA (guanine(6)-N(2))-methyltransferase THUMP3 [Pelodytes ibericus]
MSEVDLLSGNLSQVELGDSVTLPSDLTNPQDVPITIGATVPTGFEFTAAAEVEEKLGYPCKISKDRGKIYFQIRTESLAQVHQLRSVDNLFVVVQEFTDFPFKETKEAVLQDLKDLAAKLPWDLALNTWEQNNSLKKKKRRKKLGNNKEERKPAAASSGIPEDQADKDAETPPVETKGEEESGDRGQPSAPIILEALVKEVTEDPSQSLGSQASTHQEVPGAQCSSSDASSQPDSQEGGAEDSSVLKFRVTCNRAGDKHSFTSNDAARDFGGAVQEHFLWKADMTKFDIEVLLNISYNEVLVGIALTEESLHRRNITHFGPTTLRSTLAYGMLRLCELQPSDVIIDPMSGTGSIPIEGVSEWTNCFFIAGDNNSQAVNRTASNICSLLRKQTPHSATQGLPIDTVHWDISRLPLRSGSVDVIVTDMPFGKRIGSRKKNWDLYPACLREMSRVCRAGTGRAVLLTHDRKCFIKALAKAGHLWRKMHTVWVNIGGLHAGVYLLKRTALDTSGCSGEGQSSGQTDCPVSPAKEE